MESLVSLEGYDPELRAYLNRHKWPSILEALLTGLTVMTPRDPWQFISQSLVHIKETINITDIPRDIFVDPTLRGLLQQQRGTYHHGTMLTDSDHIDEEQLERAYMFRGMHLYRLCLRAWLQFHYLEKIELDMYREKLRKAEEHYHTVISMKLLHTWRGYSHMKHLHSQQAYDVLCLMHQRRLLRRVMTAWRKDAREMAQTKAFFEQQKERETEGGEWTWPERNDPVSLMDKSVTLKIFRCVGVRDLVACSRVCRSWREITQDPELWNKMDLAPFGNSLYDGGLVRQLRIHRPVLGHLSLQGCSSISPDTLQVIGECHNLQDLNLSECTITEEVMDVIARNCSGLLYLNLSYCYVTDTIIRTLASRCVNLNHLSLAYCLHFTSKGLRSIQRGKGCRRILYLDISGCIKLTAEGVQCIGAGCPILNTIILNYIPNINDAMIMSLANNCHTLRHISIYGSSHGNTCTLSDRSIKSLVQNNRKLRSIKIENSSVLTDASLRVLSRGCRDIHHIYLAGCSRLSDKGLMEIKKLKRVKVLNIADCTRVSDLGARHIAEATFNSNLRELNLTNCQKLSDISLLRLTQSCTALTHLSLAYCYHMSDTGIELLTQLPQLYSLDITGCSITDHGVASLRGNPKLRHLGVAELSDITDAGIKSMCSGLSLLECLDMSECEQITSHGLQSIAYYCHFLTQLYLTNCYQLSDDGIKYLSKGCSYLSLLDLSGTPITDKSLQTLRKGCQQLKTLNILCCINITRDEVQRYTRKRNLTISYNTDRPYYLSQGIPGLSHLETEQLINRL